MIDPAFTNISSYLSKMAKLQPFRTALIYPKGRDLSGRASYSHYNYEQLNQESDQISRGLISVGIGKGIRTVVMVKPTLDFFALTFGMFKAGAIPILIDPGIGLKQIGKCLKEIKPEAFIGIPKAQIAQLLFGWGRRTIRTFITVGNRPLWRGYTLTQIKQFGKNAKGLQKLDTQHSDDTAAIIFTSGSTGVPKGVVYTHANFLAQISMIREAYHIEPGEIDLATFPLFALFDPALGMTTVIPEMDFSRPAHINPIELVEAIRTFGVTQMFGSPALLNRMARYGAKNNVQLPSLKRVLSAGAPVSTSILDCFSKLLSPEAEIFTPYGATESLPVCSIGSKEILAETKELTLRGAGICIGRPLPGLKVFVIQILDAAIPTFSNELLLPVGEVGEMIVQGPQVTRSYYSRSDLTSLAKIEERNGNSFYHRMGDLGYFDEKGRLWFCGRKSQRVITENETLFTIPCEAVFNSHPAVFRSALVGVNRKGKRMPVLCVELEKPSNSYHLGKVRNELFELKSSFPHLNSIQTFLFHPSFPVDIRHNAKIFREKLAQWAEKKLS